MTIINYGSILVNRFSGRWPILSKLSENIFVSNTNNEAAVKIRNGITLSIRNSKLELQLIIPSDRVEDFFTALNLETVPETIKEISNHTCSLMFEILGLEKSIEESPEYRLYAFNCEKCVCKKSKLWNMEPYKFNVPDESPLEVDSANEFYLLGFYINKSTGLVSQYKYYFTDVTSNQEMLYRFNSDGTLIEKVMSNNPETMISTVTDEIKSKFNLSGVDLTGFRTIYFQRPGTEHYYLILSMRSGPDDITAGSPVI